MISILSFMRRYNGWVVVFGVIQVFSNIVVDRYIVFLAYDGQISFACEYFSEGPFYVIHCFDFYQDGK
jgi:hypothetical protein